jgi:isopentenyl diphosphate isomerase/L-lactate dehydrogenase-like FMN-dependent dehydrogenase
MADETRLAQQGYNIEQLRRLARARLPRAIFDFADGGAEDEGTLRRNEGAFADWDLVPRPLAGAAEPDTAIELFGDRLAMPILVGPTGLAGLFWPKGEIASARAAATAGTVYCQSHGSVCSIEELAANHDGPRWMQVFIYRDRGFTRELADRAAAAGCRALVLTVDNQWLGKRERDLVNGFAIPPRFGVRELAGFARRIPWWWSMRSEVGRITFGNYVRDDSRESVAALAGRMASMLDRGMCWDDVEALRAHWRGPLLLKGILHPAEAVRAVRAGVDGLIVSNHGGRQLDGAIASLDALPAIVRAVDGSVPVLLDGGIRRGAHVLKAMALGARAVLVGRPQLWGLASAGEAGVAHALGLLRAELERAMGLVGLQRLDPLHDGIVRRREAAALHEHER